MSRFQKVIIIIASIFFIGIGVIGCEQEGPAERAGEKVDEGVEDMKEKGEELGDEMED